jgi:hypothetical protein
MDTPPPRPDRTDSPAPNGFELELEGIETDTELRKTRKQSSAQEQDTLADITFTKPGEALLTGKSMYSRAKSLASSKSQWQAMRDDFTSLNTQKKAILSAAIGIVLLLVAFWILRAGVRAVAFAVKSGTAAARDVVGKVQNNVAGLTERGAQFADKVQAIVEEAKPQDEEVASIVPPKVAEARRLRGQAWPGRNEDGLSSKDFAHPTEVINGILIHKGVDIRDDGCGVFHIDPPMTAEKPAWIGGFRLFGRGSSAKAKLHGTVVHHIENGDTFVARYNEGDLSDFWVSKGPDQNRVVVYVRATVNRGKPIPDGAAFVLDERRTSCLAFVFEKGEPIGAQWCVKARDERGRFAYSPPTDLVTMTEMKADSKEFQDYSRLLEQAITEFMDIDSAADAALQKYKRQMK